MEVQGDVQHQKKEVGPLARILIAYHAGTNPQVTALVDKSKERVADYVEHGREVVDRGRAQWEEFVERGKSLVNEQTSRVAAAAEAGRQAYNTTEVTDEPAEI